MTSQTDRAQVFTISITPFTEDGQIDEGRFRRHLRKLGDAGMGVYVGGGGSGEGYTLSAEETRRVLDIAVDELKGRAPIRAMGIEPRTAEQMVAFLETAKAAGVDAAQIYSLDVGHGHSPTPRELDRYFSEVTRAVDMPMIMSTHQSVGYVIPTNVIADLFKDNDRLVGLNISHQDPNYLRTLIDALADRIDICTGGPHQALLCFALGGHGYLSSEGNLAPKLCLSVVDAWKRGDAAALLEMHGKLMRLFMALYGNGGIRVTKAVLERLGLAGGYPRLPRVVAEDDATVRAMGVVDGIGLAEIEGW
ncbi:dihydrodipicolinate synthase family protein [Sphingoaurantiacus capsulatus]|uniref:Dihydrodipicolinate synthase family protein n=1 Tax=Sphingoaurantiacus capsulatus TaxID=1771310 RepID=A0ABV7XAE5_9SPHN